MESALRPKIAGMYSAIGKDFYLNRNDFLVSGQSFNSTLLLGVLTELNRGKLLLFGEYGGGKTTVAEYLNSAFYGMPLELVRKAVLRADPQKTEEKIVGRPDYGKLHGQEEAVVWQHFVLLPGKIIDEFNRLPEPNQSMLLNGVDRGEWSYLNDAVFTGREALFATCNYADRGNGDLIEPMLDRFDVSAESKFPGVTNAFAIAQNYGSENDSRLKNPDLYKKALAILNSKKPYEEIRTELGVIAANQMDHMKSNGLPVIMPDELSQIEKEIYGLKFDKDAEIYTLFLISELNVSAKYGQKRSNDPLNKSDGKYLGLAFTGSGSRRADKSIVRYAKSLAWLTGQDRVTLDHVATIAPYVLWHRIKFSDEARSAFKDDQREDPLELHITKNLLQEGTSEFPGVKKRFMESRVHYEDLLFRHAKGDDEGALRLARQYSADGKGHPIFTDLERDLSR